MFRLIESIKVENKQICQGFYHNQRMNMARQALFSCKDEIDIRSIINLPDGIDDTVYKLRIIYDININGWEIKKYKKRRINSLKLVRCDDIDYQYKYENRKLINDLLKQKGNYDDILIIKNGFVTDTSFSNIIFWDGKQWHTPDTPLLKGTKRTFLLDKGLIHESRISLADLKRFYLCKPINALLDVEKTEAININKII